MLQLRQRVRIKDTKEQGMIVGRTHEQTPLYDIMISTPDRGIRKYVPGAQLEPVSPN